MEASNLFKAGLGIWILYVVIGRKTPHLCCVAQIPWPLDKRNQRIVQRRLLAAPPLHQLLHHLYGLVFTWTCSKISQEHNCISIVEIKKSCLLLFLDNPLIAGMTKRENLFHRGCLPSTLHTGWRWCWGSQHLKGCFLQCVNSIVNESAFFNGTSSFQHKRSPCVYIVSLSLLLAQCTTAGKTMGALGFTVAPATH